MKQYLDVLRDIRENGEQSTDRTGVGTLRIPGAAMRFDLRKGFPIVTTKKVPFRILVAELLWFIRGDTNVRTLILQNCNIWNDNAFARFAQENEDAPRILRTPRAELRKLLAIINKPEATEEDRKRYETLKYGYIEAVRDDEGFARRHGDLGPIYGAQWRKWVRKYTPYGQSEDIVHHIDQLGEALATIGNNPDSRRIIVSAWNPEDISEMALPPCHCLFQFLVINGKLNLNLYQRSCDMFLGVPFNISSYALLLSMVAHVMGLEVGSFFHVLGDAHIYLNHLDAVDEQLSREPRLLPTLVLNPERVYIGIGAGPRPIDILESFTADDIKLEGYTPHGPIKAPMAV